MGEYEVNPPKWPLKILRWIIKKDYIEEIEGDMEEVFQDNLENYSVKKAKNIYAWEVLKLIRPRLIKNLEGNQKLNQFGMFKNNLKIAFRVLKADYVYSAVNIIGLALGMALTLLILLYAQFELSYEKSNPMSDRIVRVTMDYLSGETLVDQDCETYPPLGPRIKQDLPEIEEFARAYNIGEVTFKVEDQYYKELDLYAVDPSFLKMFNYPLIRGNEEGIFENPFEIILTESQAMKYYETTDVVGKIISIPGLDHSAKIVGVIGDSPENTHLKFRILVSFPTLKAALGEKDDNWEQNNTFTYLQLTHPDRYADFTNHLLDLNYTLLEEKKLENEAVVSELIQDIHLYSDKSFEPEKNGDARSVFFLLGVGMLVILIAIVNYINLSTSKSLDRAREVGIRKVVGANLGQLRIQFFTESLLINLLACIVALALISVSFDWFKYVADLPPTFIYYNKAFFWAYLIAVFVISSLLAGLFPALIMANFMPVKVLKGRFSHSKSGVLLRKGLVIFQFAVTLFLLVQTFAASRQLNFLKAIDLGLNTEKTVVVRSAHSGEAKNSHETFKNELLAESIVQSVGLSSSVPGLPTSELSTTTGINLVEALEKTHFNFYVYWIDSDFIKTMQIKLVAGENYEPDIQHENNIIINEEAVRVWGITNPQEVIGKEVEFWGKKAKILGVIGNFHQASAKSNHVPMMFIYRAGFSDLASIRVAPGNINDHIDRIEKIYNSAFPTSPFEFFFLDQEYDKQYRADEQFQQVFATLTLFAIIIACLGLFGLASFTVAKRTKEIGIRKVMGANELQVITMISKDFMNLILIAMVLAIPITYWIVENWLQKYPTRIDLGIWLFALPAFGVIAVAFLTIMAKTFRVSLANPSESLRDE